MNISKIYKRNLIIICLGVFSLFSFLVVATLIFQDKIIFIAVNEINRFLKTRIEVDPEIKVSILDKFPEVSIKFKNVKIHENLPNSKDVMLAEAGSLYITFDAFNLLNKRYTVNDLYFEDGYIHLRIDKSGAKNYEIINVDSTKATEENFEFSLEKIILKNVAVIYDNLVLKQKHEFTFLKADARLELNKNIYKIDLNSSLYVSNIFIDDKGYFKGKNILLESNLKYDLSKDILSLNPSSLKVDNADFKIDGNIILSEKKRINLNIKEENASIHTLISLLPEHIVKEFENYKSSGMVYCNAKIDGYISNKEIPHIQVNFGCNDATLSHPDLPYEINKINLKGKYSNGKNNNVYSSFLEIEQFECLIDQKAFNGNIVFSNFSDPNISCTLKGEIDTKVLLNFITLEEVKQLQGFLKFDVTCKGRINDLRKKETASKVKTDGIIHFGNVEFFHSDYKLKFKNINGIIDFNNNDITAHNLEAHIGTSDLKVNGDFKNLLSRLFFPEQPVLIRAYLYSNYLNIDELKSSQKAALSSTRTQVNKSESQKPGKYFFNVDTEIKKLKYEKFVITNLLAGIKYSDDKYSISESMFNMASGEVRLALDVEKNTIGQSNCKASIVTRNVKIDSLFYVFDNFEQEFITYRQISGDLTTSVDAIFQGDRDNFIKMNTVKAEIIGSVTNGELVNFSPMKSLSKFIDEKKLERVIFSELTNRIVIENSVITVPEMEIKSNVSNIIISGTHSLSNEMDYKLTVPLKNFKKEKRDSDEAFGAIEMDERGTSNVFLTIKGTSKDFKVAYDTKKTKQKIKNDLKKEGKELKDIFRNKKTKQEQVPVEDQQEFFDF